MNRGLLALALTLGTLAALGCGNPKSNATVNSSNSSAGNHDDNDVGSIFPDVNPFNSSNGVNNRMDLGRDVDPPDLGDVSNDVSTDGPADMMMMSCPRMNVGYGQACGCNQECTSNVCVDASLTEDGFCSIGCGDRTDCVGGDACVTDRFGISVCRDDDTGANCTMAGLPEPELCSARHCTQAGSNYPIDYFCSVPCTTAADCDVGHACSPVRCQYQADGSRCIPTVVVSRAPNKAMVLASFPEARKLCIKVGDPNPCQNVQSDEQACPGSLCDEDPVGRCTSQCLTTADCPSGGCVDYDVSDGTLPIRVCDI